MKKLAQFIATVAIITLFIAKYEVFEDVVLFYSAKTYCPVNVTEETFLAVDLAGESKRLEPAFPKLNSWYPAKPVVGVDLSTLCLQVERIDLLLFVASSTNRESILRRENARKAWLDKTKLPHNVIYFFVVGSSNVSHENQAVINETRRHQDILVLDFLDTYRNLTSKTMSSFKWIALNCGHAKYIMKTDDDVFVNIPKVLTLLKQPQSPAVGAIVGHLYTLAVVIRDKKNKNFVPRSEYALRYYPPFCQGSGYLISMTNLQKTLKMSYFVPFISNEDAYFGVCANCAGIGVRDEEGFGGKYEAVMLSKKHCSLWRFYTVHGLPY